MARKNPFDAAREVTEFAAALITEGQRHVGDGGHAGRQISKATLLKLRTVLELLAGA